ncbi:hypothetical protein [Methylobacillus sp.]|jgi:hypothetical protein|uniref:hypothetical protein n=1 Tax=Methylobacillus sp. TaxID=56818 RepID=UPI002FE219E7
MIAHLLGLTPLPQRPSAAPVRRILVEDAVRTPPSPARASFRDTVLRVLTEQPLTVPELADELKVSVKVAAAEVRKLSHSGLVAEEGVFFTGKRSLPLFKATKTAHLPKK